MTQLVHFHYPGTRLTRTTEDDCDVCVRIDVLLTQCDLPDNERESLELEKRMHLDTAVNQWRVVSTFAKDFVSKHCPDQVVEIVVPDYVDDLSAAKTALLSGSSRIQIQIQDYSGSFAMPYYGHSRSSADYFNSNLMMQNFIMADISNQTNHVGLYDEHGQ